MKPKKHAELLVERIRAFWRARGADPAVEIVFVDRPRASGATDKRDGVWTIQSDMRGGMPKGFNPRNLRPPFLKD